MGSDATPLLSTQGDVNHIYEDNLQGAAGAAKDAFTDPLGVTRHTFSKRYLQNVAIAKLTRIPLRLLIIFSYYLVHGPLYLWLKYSVRRRSIRVPSRHKGRTIRVDIYTPSKPILTADAPPTANGQRKKGAAASRVGPVHLNFHGSGFVLDCMGADGDQCGYFANKMRCTVLDVDYRKAPEYPFPAAVYDAEDVCNYVFAHPELFDTTKVSVGGASAGATISLATGVQFGSRINAVCAIAPVTDLRPTARPKYAPEKGLHALPKSVGLYFDSCYLVQNVDRGDPRVSPMTARIEAPYNQLSARIVYIATGTGDTLHKDGEELIASLQKQGHPNAIFRSIKGEGHAFEKAIRPSPRKDKALAVFNEIIELIVSTWHAKPFVGKATSSL